MTGPSEAVANTAFQLFGPWAACLLILGAVVWYLVRENKDLRVSLDAEHKSRLSDAKEHTASYLELSERLHESLETVSKILERSGPRTRLPESR